MTKADVNEIAQSSEWHDDEETKAGRTGGVHSSFLAEWGERPSTDDDDDDGGGSDSLWEDISDHGIDASPEEIIELIMQTLDTTPEDDPARAEMLSTLGQVLYDRHLKTGAIVDLDEAVGAMRQVTNILPSGDLELAGALHNLGLLLGHKYLRTNAPADLEEAIQVTRQAVDTTPEGHPEWVARVNSLALRLSDRYSYIGAVCDLEEATHLARRALKEAPDDHPDYPGLLTNLGARLGDQSVRTGEITDLEEGIRYMRQAVDITSNDHLGQPILLNNLGHHLGERYLRTGAVVDLEEAIQVLRQAVRITPDDDAGQAASLNNLGLQLGQQYLRTGATGDLDEAIQYTQQAVDMTPEDNMHWAAYKNNLGVQLGDRYLRTGAIVDLEEAIRILRQAIHATPESHPTSAALSTNLGIQLSNQYSRTKAKAALEEAIQITKQGLKSIPEDHPNRIVQLDILAILLGHRYSETRAIVDLEEAIQVARQAVNVTPQSHLCRAGVLNNLGDELNNLFLRTGDIADLEEAITYLQQAVQVMPQDHPDRSALLGNLGDQLNSRYTKTGAVEDRQNAIAYYQVALHQANSYTLSRIWAGRGVLQCSSDWQQAYTAASIAVGLVPRLSPRSLQNSDRQHALGQVVGLASDAAAIALQAGQTPLVALGLLEQGRGVQAASLEEVRSDIMNLQSRNPQLAEQFMHLRDELETAATQNLQLEGRDLEIPRQARKSRRYEARKEFDQLVTKIQKLPGFEDFLLPPSETEIKAAARCGPIVVINVSKYRCDALLVEPHRVQAMALTQLSIEEVEEKAWGADLGSHEVLEWLWDKVIQQILDALGFTQPPSSDESWPHVWWIPTGPLSKFPLHAAGHHSARSAETVLDRVMSTYASSIKAIIHGRNRRLQPAASAQALLVAMEHTPGNEALPFATKEVAMVRDLCRSMSLQPTEPGCRKQDIKSNLPDCKIFHFAGHGGTDEYDASNSRLIMEDSTLRVAELLEMNLLERSPFLAYLSACGTGRIKDERSTDESIHLISAFQLAGFRHVVGTLWEVKDELCVDMARITYEGMRDGGMTDESVCRGLHQASRMLRNQYLTVPTETEDRSLPQKVNFSGGMSSEEPKGTQSLRDVGVFDAGSAPWAPYVHFGV
ncbi:hypothetical protein ACEPPN_014132 [Leptodophora sp. 'Broadleaf-Isolate-01']